MSNDNLEVRLEKLKSIIKEMGSVVVAFSGGVDSSLVLKVCQQVLGKNVLAVTAKSPTYPENECRQAVNLASKMGIEHLVIKTDELNTEVFASNPADRCYHCKKELFEKLKDIAGQRSFGYVVEGSTLTDAADYRPGRKAIAELDIRSPLREAGLDKEQVRAISRHLGLPTWDKPAYACLASRIPYGQKITEEKLKMVERAEDFLHSLGFSQVRVRHHRHLARIEVPADEIDRISQPQIREKIVSVFKELGYNYVTIDLEGYRTGSLNEVLPKGVRYKSP